MPRPAKPLAVYVTLADIERLRHALQKSSSGAVLATLTPPTEKTLSGRAYRVAHFKK